MSGINIRSLPAALKRKAEEELNETSERLYADLETLKDWINEKPELGSLPDQWLVAILRGSKYNINKAKNKIEKYNSLKDIAPEFYTNRDPFDPKIQELLKLGLFLPVRNVVTEDASRICLVRVAQLPETQYNLSDLIKVSFMVAEILFFEDDNFTIAGVVCLEFDHDHLLNINLLKLEDFQFRLKLCLCLLMSDLISDMDKTGFVVLTQWNPFLARKWFICSEGTLAVRIKSLNLINSPRGINAAISILRMFLTAKLKNRIQVFRHDYEGLYDSVPKSVLPVEYGGIDGTLIDLTDYWKTKVESYRAWFLHQEISK